MRLRVQGSGGVRADLTDGPGPGEARVTLEGVDLILADELAGTLDADDHNDFTLVP